MRFLFEKQYSKEELEGIIDVENIRRLISKGVINVVSSEKMYSIQFVGIIFLGRKIICVLPKFLQNENLDAVKTMQLILKVLRTYEHLMDNVKQKDEEYLITNIGSRNVSDFFLASFLLEDYKKNGYYRKDMHVITKNGEGEIDWQRTISDITPIVSNQTPYYFETYNRNKDSDVFNKVMLLHKLAIRLCYDKFAGILGLQDIELDKSCLDMRGKWSKQFINSLLDRELRTVYIDRKILVLKALKTLFTRETFFENSGLTLFGTKSFQNIWEHACARVFKNEYKDYENEIPRPKWINTIENEINESKRTLKPDVIRRFDQYLLILDAKYYDIKFNQNKLKNNPGVEDVVKQIVYAKALQTDLAVTKKNVFLFPQKKEKIFEMFGIVKMEFLSQEPISLIYLSYEEVFNLYINKKNFSDKILYEFIEILK